jgi:hypothetical protein
MKEDKNIHPRIEDFEGDWNKWAAYVLNSITELKYDMERTCELFSDRDSTREQNCPYRFRIHTLEAHMKEMEKAVQNINMTMAKWSGVIIAANTLLALGMAVLLRYL